MNDFNMFVSKNYPSPIAPTVVVQQGERPVVDSKEAAEMLGVTLNNLRQIVHSGRLAVAKKEGRQNYYSQTDVETLKASRNNARGIKAEAPNESGASRPVAEASGGVEVLYQAVMPSGSR